VLPTKDQLERADVTLWDFLSPCVAAQHTPAVVDAVGDRRSTWWVLGELGRRLGHDLKLTAGADTTDDKVLERITRGARCTFDELAATGWIERAHDVPAAWVERHIERLGGWRLAPQPLVDQLAALDVPDRPLVLLPRRQVRHLNSQLDYLGEMAAVVVHPDDATPAGIVDGDPVVVRSAHGELVATASVDASIRPGAVSLPHGHQRANVNRLTGRDAVDRLTGMVQYSGIPVTLHPLDERPQPASARPPT
jgi:anaerobic selenocysteine-containing dehydrogenase